MMTERDLRSARRSLLRQRQCQETEALPRTERTFNFNKTIQYDEELAIITSRTWTIYHVSPLHNLNYSKLKKYNKLLRENLVRNLPSSKQNVKYKVKFTQLPGLAETQYDSGAIMINIRGTINNVENAVEKTEFVGILLSRGRSIPNATGDHISLPIFLCYGLKQIIKAVCIVLKELFDCLIVQGRFTNADLMWLSAVFCEDNSDLSEEQRKVKFTYKCSPSEPERFVIRHNTADIDCLWKAIHDENSPDIYENEIVRFHNELNRHWFLSMEIDVFNMHMDRIAYPHITISAEGRICVKDINSAAQILKFICELPTRVD